MVSHAVAQSDEIRTPHTGEALRPAPAIVPIADTSQPASARLELTHVTKKHGPLTKVISLVDGEMGSDASECRLVTGHARRVRVGELKGATPLAALAELMENMPSDQALCLGRLADGVCDEPRVVTARRLKERQGAGGAQKHCLISRSREFLGYAENEPALMMVDFDCKGMPPEVAELIDKAGGVWNALVGVIPGLAAAGRIRRLSTSAGLYNAKTAQQFAESGGEHHHVLVADGSDIPRALGDLHKRTWLKGLGWIWVSASGQLLERSVIDRAVGLPERLVFEGAPVLVPPLAQDEASRRPVAIEGEAIDTRVLIPPLTAAEQAVFSSLVAEAERKLKPEARKVKDKADDALAVRIAKERGIDISTARRHVEARHEGKLMPSLLLEFDDDEIGTVAVGKVLDNPDRYEGETLADPLEGIAYGRCKAKIMRRDDGGLFINSFAHGHAIYDLMLDAESLQRMLDDAARDLVGI
jgi:hypothetical protein